VNEVEKYFFQLTAEILRNAYIPVFSHGYIWSVETSSGKWKPYSYRVHRMIESAHIEFDNEKSERCQIIFSSMQEEYQTRKRTVKRRRIDLALPNYWDLSDANFNRLVLLESSKEYIDVLNQFNSTMKNNYSEIIKIERIQNERWYKQYAAHRDDFIQRYTQPDERLLFHGCNSISADKIVQECFNRAFAGVNARVLIGKTCVGKSSMKVPPEGFDTTTDGKHIFVVYHDAGAYGEYLITYK
ncbi:unnamed protein product, partial [Rotaria sp. Silwood2]